MKTNPFKEFFYFAKGDRRAIVALGCIAVFCLGVLLVVDAWSDKEIRNSPAEEVEFDIKGTGEIVAGQLCAFDPNTVDSLTLVSFGLKTWKVRNFLHYRAAGKVFRSAEDLGDTYGWTDADVERLSPYVHIAPQYQRTKIKSRVEKERTQTDSVPSSTSLSRTYTSSKFRSLTKVNVNAADTALLRRIPGIGEKISLAIVDYRQRLGGYHSVQQLLEIKIVSPELLEWFEIPSSSTVQHFNLNKASFQALNSHPYISYEQAKALLQYIRLYGDVKDAENLLATGIFTKDELEKLRPYIVYE